MEISSEEEEEKKTETSFSSNEMQKQVSLDRFLVKVAQKESQQIAVIPLVTMKVVLPN
jgi:hypothetical protein